MNSKSSDKQDFMQSLSTRDNLTSTNKTRQNPMDDRFSKNLKFHQCYVEEQAKMRDSFMYDSFKILKSLVKKLANFVAYI